MAESGPRATLFTIVAATLALIALLIGSFMLGRRTSKPESPPATSIVQVPDPPKMPEPVLPTSPSLLGRAELIEAAARGADAFGAGKRLPESVTDLAGRDFELRLPFGCPGAPQPGPDGLSAGYDEAAKTLRMRVQPARWQPEEWLPDPAGMPPEAPVAESIEGFWISRPWTSSETCPAHSAAATPPVPAEQTLGIAQFFTPADSRIGRRDGKAYEAVERIPPEALTMDMGLRLRLRGKITGSSEIAPVLCNAPAAVRPVCILAVEFDEVAIENPLTGAVLARWDVSGQPQEPKSGSDERR